MNSMTKANSKAWDAVAKAHYENYHVAKLIAGEPILNELVKTEVGDVHGKSLLHLLCHIGTDTLSWGLLGAQVTGVDISADALKYARKLAGQSGIEATFIHSDVMELPGKTRMTYDIVFASIGVLCWIPDIDKFAVIVRQLLKPGGFFYLLDGHPFRYMMLEETEQGEVIVNGDYFHTGAWEYDDFTDYIIKGLDVSTKSYEWGWALGRVVTAFCQAGMRIEFLHEFPQDFYGGYTGHSEVTDQRKKYPCTFSLKAVAE